MLFIEVLEAFSPEKMFSSFVLFSVLIKSIGKVSILFGISNLLTCSIGLTLMPILDSRLSRLLLAPVLIGLLIIEV